VSESPIFIRELRAKKASTVPIAQLRFGQAGKPLNLFLAEGGYNVSLVRSIHIS
jgi:hypothetical protein